jgi:hypothetical protein
MTPEEREAKRQEIEEDVRRFLQKGGKITQIPEDASHLTLSTDKKAPAKPKPKPPVNPDGFDDF